MVGWGFWGWGLSLGLWGWGFQLLGPVVWGLLGCWGWGSLYKHNPGKNGAFQPYSCNMRKGRSSQG